MSPPMVTLVIYQLGGIFTGELTFGVGTVAALVVLAGALYLLFRPDPNKKQRAMAAKVRAAA